MEKILEYRKSTIKINNKVILKDLDFAVAENTNTAIIGTSASGKTTILKSLAKKGISNNLYYNGKYVNNYDEIHKNIGVVLNDTIFLSESVKKELAFSLQNLNINLEGIEKRIEYIITFFELQEYVEYDPNLLSTDLKTLLKILSFLIFEPKVIAIDDLFIYLTTKQKEKIIEFLKEKNITLLLVTSDIEDTLYTEYIYILAAGKVVAEGYRDSIYKEEKLLNRIGLGLPFMIDLSTQLMHYELIDKFYLEKEKLAGEVWK